MIFPVPQENKLNGGAVLTGGVAFCVEGEWADYAQKFLKSSGIDTSGSYKLLLKKSDDENFGYIPQAYRRTDEKYIIAVEQAFATITFSARRGLFRALNTLVRLVDSNSLKAGELTDFPLFERRGYIEGFYGAPWSDENRRDVLKLMSAHGMNSWFYAPKDDAYHREKWRENYPDALLASLKSLVELAQSRETDFFYCVAPGLTMRYSSDDDMDTLFNKLMQLYSIGVRCFGLLLDDIPETLQYSQDRERFNCAYQAHAFVCNELYRRLTAFDKAITLVVCPLQYHGEGNEEYISRFGSALDKNIELFWTGRDICSQRITTLEACVFTSSTHRRPLYWDNYPVNDTEMLNEMHLGPVMGRESELYGCTKGLIANTMEFAQCSKIPLLTVADYLWNPLAYNKDKSFEYAVKKVTGDESEKFMLIAEHLQVSCLSRYASQGMSDFFGAMRFELMSGRRESAAKMLDEYTSSLESCAAMLMQDKPLYNELRQWSEKFRECASILRACVTLLQTPSESLRRQIKQRLVRYNRDGTVLTGFCFTETVTFITNI